MRLQLSVYRHTLPPVNIIYATGTGPASQTANSSATVFNLLEDINDLIPLESSDGEWGLEDYVVEVAATADQEELYQCLHYLPLKSVLREDDEVLIRPLGNDDLRAWRRGGRMQISTDGRHLIDGVVFSKPWVRKDRSRPGITIPPRKRRRVLLDDEEESQKENLEPQELLLPAATIEESSDDEQDEDYNGGLDRPEISLKEIFEDADASEEELSDVDGDEVQLLLQDAAEVESAADVDTLLETQLQARTRLGKRKRQLENDSDDSDYSDYSDDSDDVPFEGFESPLKTRALQDVSHQFNGIENDRDSENDSMLDEITQQELLKKQKNLVNGDDSDDSSDADFASSTSTSDSEDDQIDQQAGFIAETEGQGSDSDSIMEEAARQIIARRLANQIEGDDDDESSDADFSASSSDSDSDSESPEPDLQKRSDARNNVQRIESPSGGAQSEDSDSSSSDESDSSSSSEDSDSSDSSADSAAGSETSSTSDSDEDLTQKRLSQTDAEGTQVRRRQPKSSVADSDSQKPAQSTPGQGSIRTKNNNMRVKRRRRLNALKAKGLLSADADFNDLDRYDGTVSAGEASSMQVQDELEAARHRALAQLSDPPSHDGHPDELGVAQSIEPQNSEQTYEEDDSLMIPETQDRGDATSRGSPLRVPVVPDKTLAQLSQQAEPERACEWLKLCFHASPADSVSQDAVWVAYNRCFKDHRALPGSAFLPCVLKVFKEAHVVDPFDPYTAIRGIRPKDHVEDVVEDTAHRAVNLHEVDTPAPASAAHTSISALETSPIADSIAAEPTEPALAEPSPKRTKLDVSATRRLIFGALGSRNPKTPAQAQAVREKLAGPARPVKPRLSASTEEPVQEDKQDDGSLRWQDRLIVTAVECEREGVKYPPPPFPFVQHWHKTSKAKRQSAQMDRVPSQESKASRESQALKQDEELNSMANQVEATESVAESRTVSFDRDDRDGMPIPSNFEALMNLDHVHLLPGTVIAFKQLEVDMSSFQPKLSGFKVARIDLVREDLTIELTLATRSRIPSLQTSEDPDQSENKYSQFVIQASEEDDGIREIAFSEMQEAKLIEASSIQVQASHTAPAADDRPTDLSTQEISTQAVAESVEQPAANTVNSLSQSTEALAVASPRRHEISAIMQEAGFDSAIGDFRLDVDVSSQAQQPSQSQNTDVDETHAQKSADGEESVLSQARANTSSPLFPPQSDDIVLADDDDEANPVVTDEAPVPTSSPPVSPQLTVEYPSISHIELESDVQQPNSISRNGSSHQDAQRQSPDILEADTTLIASEQKVKLRPIDEGSAIPSNSEVPRSSQPAQTEEDELDMGREGQGAESSRPGSFLDVGADGQVDSSFRVSDEDYGSDSSDSLPSLDHFTSSQKRKIMTRATSTSKSSKKISPPPTKRGRLRNSATSKYYISLELSDDGSDDDAILPKIKTESGDNGSKAPRLSQIPAGTQVVDLTLSSDPVSPGGSDGEFQMQASRSRARNINGNSQGRVTRRAVTEGSSQSGTGIGQRKMLTTKKTRSFV